MYACEIFIDFTRFLFPQIINLPIAVGSIDLHTTLLLKNSFLKECFRIIYIYMDTVVRLKEWGDAYLAFTMYTETYFGKLVRINTS